MPSCPSIPAAQKSTHQKQTRVIRRMSSSPALASERPTISIIALGKRLDKLKVLGK